MTRRFTQPPLPRPATSCVWNRVREGTQRHTPTPNGFILKCHRRLFFRGGDWSNIRGFLGADSHRAWLFCLKVEFVVSLNAVFGTCLTGHTPELSLCFSTTLWENLPACSHIDGFVAQDSASIVWSTGNNGCCDAGYSWDPVVPVLTVVNRETWSVTVNSDVQECQIQLPGQGGGPSGGVGAGNSKPSPLTHCLWMEQPDPVPNMHWVTENDKRHLTQTEFDYPKPRKPPPWISDERLTFLPFLSSEAFSTSFVKKDLWSYGTKASK